MVYSLKQIERELLSFRTGEPIIAELIDGPGGKKEYHLTVFVKSLSDNTPHFVQSVQLCLSLDPEFPFISPSVTLCSTRLFHPNFTADGTWTDNEVRDGETVSDYLLRLVRSLQFKYVRQDKAGNRNAMAWYNQNRNSGLFPTDKVNYNFVPHIKVIKRNDSLSS